MGLVVVVEVFPLRQLRAQIDVVGVREQLVELLLVAFMRALDPAAELRGSRLGVDVLNPRVSCVSVEERWRLVSVVRADRVDAERKLLDRIMLGVARVDLGDADEAEIIGLVWLEDLLYDL